MPWVHVLLLTLFFALLPPSAATAKVYRCEGANGGSILTDQPKGKRGCAVIETAAPSPPGGFTPPVEPTPPARPDIPPDVAPSSTAPQHSRRPSATGQVPSLEGHADSSAPAAPPAARCPNGVNPLNPFAALNCSPAVLDGSEEKKER